MEIGYSSNYEHYTVHDYKKKRKIKTEPFNITPNIILFMVILITPFILVGNYCHNNFGISLANGERNKCQDFGYLFYKLFMSMEYRVLSGLFYFVIGCFIIFIIGITGFYKNIIRYLNDSFSKLYNYRYSGK